MNQKLQNQITSKLTTLAKIIEQIRNKVIEPDNSEMWDSSYYYDLSAKLKEALTLLEDKKDQKLADCGQPIILEVGILSLLDDWEEEKEND